VFRRSCWFVESHTPTKKKKKLKPTAFDLWIYTNQVFLNIAVVHRISF